MRWFFSLFWGTLATSALYQTIINAWSGCYIKAILGSLLVAWLMLNWYANQKAEA